MNAQFVASVITMLVAIPLILGACAYLILLERKVSAWIQDRTGPNRTGFGFGLLPIRHHCWGLGQPLADGLKLLFKEDYTPPGVDRTLFFLAPIAAVSTALVGWAVIPWGGFFACEGTTLPGWLPFVGGAVIEPFVVNIAAAPVNIGILYILAVSSLAVYGVVLAGFASNNKYSFLGGLRATAQMLSYEIPMGLIVLVMILSAGGAVSAHGIVHEQANGVWFIFLHPLLAIIFFTCVLAECNRAPFDLAEAEQELVGGFHTEYASLRWGLFFLGEYTHMITGAGFFTILFLGGWDLPLIREPLVGGIGWVLLKTAAFALKIGFLLFVMMWIRWTLPRLRFDQLMKLAWRGVIPITLVMLLVAGLVVYLQMPAWTLPLAEIVVAFGGMTLGPLMPGEPAMNRRIGLAGSRFSPLSR